MADPNPQTALQKLLGGFKQGKHGLFIPTGEEKRTKGRLLERKPTISLPQRTPKQIQNKNRHNQKVLKKRRAKNKVAKQSRKVNR